MEELNSLGMLLLDGKTICHRCKSVSNGLSMSFFNTDWICIECNKKEIAHPEYAKAKEAEVKEIINGNLNFKGIGKPADL